jgi:hypothetical protein
LRVAMEQQNRWTIATDKHVNCRAASLDRLASESREEVHRPSGYGLSEGGRALRGQCPGSYADAALKERTPAKRVPTRKPACQQAWIEICHGDLSVLFGRDYAAQPRARAVARMRVWFAKLHLSGRKIASSDRKVA